jgi:beta-lactamase regulating signal transducer with metallopeptidase domain
VSALLALSLKGAAVAALVAVTLAVAERLRTEVPAFLRHALWLVVFVRLLVPVLPASPASLLSLGAPLEEAGGGLLPGLDLDRLASGAAPADGQAGPGAEESAGPADRWWLAAAGVWLLGLVALTGRATVRELRVRRRLRDAAPVKDPAVLAALEEARRRVGVPPGVPVLETAEVAAPAIHGALRPRILLPPDAARALGPEVLCHALLHELVHVRRRDGATRLLARLAAAVHWFNPAAWYALARLEAECELACDAGVLECLGERERTGYGRTLLHAATLVSPRATATGGGLDRRDPLAGAVTALPLSTHQTLKRRIQMIARYRTPSRLRLAAFCLAAGALAFVALTYAPLSAEPAAPAQASGGGAAAADVQASKETLESLRNGGTAMFSWITDAMIEAGETTMEEAVAAQDGEGEDPVEAPAGPQALSWTDCPSIRYEELRELLVPDYITVSMLPRTDGWGHALEFCLDRTPADSTMLIAGIRSPGKDGVFDTDAYTAGPFAVSDFDRDTVWIDGFFVRWPSKDAGN